MRMEPSHLTAPFKVLGHRMPEKSGLAPFLESLLWALLWALVLFSMYLNLFSVAVVTNYHNLKESTFIVLLFLSAFVQCKSHLVTGSLLPPMEASFAHVHCWQNSVPCVCRTKVFLS